MATAPCTQPYLLDQALTVSFHCLPSLVSPTWLYPFGGFGVKLAESIDSNISEKLAVLRAARTFAESIGDATEINCPACGQAVTADGFSEHVKTETERLQEAEDAFDTYKSVVGSVCNCLEALKSNLRKPDLKDWTDGFSDQALRNGLQYLGACPRISAERLKASLTGVSLA